MPPVTPSPVTASPALPSIADRSSAPDASAPLPVGETSDRGGKIQTTKILTEADRRDALEVIRRVYFEEKRWIQGVEEEVAPDFAESRRVSWFLCRHGGEPAGVIRLTYDPPLEIPPEMEFRFDQPIDLDRLARACRFVEIGRFMIRPRYRRGMGVALSLMKESVREVAERGYTHFITDVLESDPHSPLGFHTRVLGFQRIGTHRYGELATDSLRIILVLDIARAYRRLAERRNRVFRQLSDGIQHLLDRLPPTPVLPSVP